MFSSELSKNISKVTNELSLECEYDFLKENKYFMPDNSQVIQAMNILESVILPYCENYYVNKDSIHFYLGRDINLAANILYKQIINAIKINFLKISDIEAKELAESSLISLINALPSIKKYIINEIETAFNNDPAAKSPIEILVCYPALKAILYHKIAHELYLSEIPIIPRMINEISHSLTGIDIHPGATIGENFFIDHGTGIIIGETTIIGNNVRIYQGVTLGAKTAALDENGKPIRGIPRHPIIEDDVVIYPNSTILGRIVIGRGAIIGGNLWVTEEVPPNSRLSQ